MINRIVKTLHELLRLNRATESLIIDVIASYSPWLAPLVPAYMTYQHMTGLLDFPRWAALAAWRRNPHPTRRPHARRLRRCWWLAPDPPGSHDP